MKELWKQIPNIPNYYASNLGNLKSVFNNKEHILHPYPKKCRSEKNTYMYIRIRRKNYRVHRLILAAFTGEMRDLDVNHLDGNKLNNRLDNLEWCTKKENMIHALKNNLLTFKDDYLPISAYRPVPIKDLTTNKNYSSITEASRDLSIGASSISGVVNGKHKHTHGHIFVRL